MRASGWRALRRRSRSSWTARLAAAGVMIAISAGVYSLVSSTADNVSAASPKPTSVQIVQTIRPIRADMAHSFNTNGTLEAFETADLYPKVSGYLAEVRVDIG